jgi:hypothetical protein
MKCHKCNHEMKQDKSGFNCDHCEMYFVNRYMYEVILDYDLSGIPQEVLDKGFAEFLESEKKLEEDTVK